MTPNPKRKTSNACKIAQKLLNKDKKTQYSIIQEWNEKWKEMMAKKMDDTIIGAITKVEHRKPTTVEIKLQKAREKKEKLRRAKKMTITVGEYEDLLESSYYN